MCDGPKIAEKNLPGMDNAQQYRLIGALVIDKLRTPEGKAFFIKSTGQERDSAPKKSAQLRAEAQRLGIAQCGFADWLTSHDSRN